MFKFPWGDFHSLNLGWFLQKFNELREDWATAEAGIDGALDAEIQKAEDALTDVFAARDAAAASASAANSSALNASQSSLASMDARDQSRAARDAAQQAATNAAASETAAGNSATAASNSAGAAATSATQAGNSATAAGNSATAAGQSATAAGQSATNAAASETAAGNSAAAAAASETAAGNSATDAQEAASSVEASAQQILTNANDIAALKESILDSFPSRLTPLSNATDGSNTGNTIHAKNFFVDFTPVRGTGQLNILKNAITLPAGNYTWIVEILKNTIISTTNTRVGYVGLSINNANPITANRIDINESNKARYLINFALTEESTVNIIINPLFDGSGELKFYTYINYIEPSISTTTLGINNATKDTFYESVEETE